MLFEYALQIMLAVFLLNFRADGRIVAGIFLLVSIFFDAIINFASFVEGYVIYAFGELILIHLMFMSNGPDSLVKDMIRLSIVSISIQLIGALMWVYYYDSGFYIALCQMIFALQVIRLAAHGLGNREATNIGRVSMDSLHTSRSGEKL